LLNELSPGNARQDANDLPEIVFRSFNLRFREMAAETANEADLDALSL
jgi:hypothetical protein